LLGKSSLTAIGARLDLVRNVAELRVGSETTELHAIALTAEAVTSSRPQAQAYWTWLQQEDGERAEAVADCVEDVVGRMDTINWSKKLKKERICYTDSAQRVILQPERCKARCAKPNTKRRAFTFSLALLI
jgi:hypothetical protein